MTTNHDRILSEFMTRCEMLFKFVRESASGMTAYEVETRVFAEVMKMGALTMEAYLDAEAPRHHYSHVEDAEGFVLPYVAERPGLYYSIFGEVRYKRSYYSGGGRGFFALNAALNIPSKGHSDFLRTFMEEFAIDMSYSDTTAKFARYFPIAVSTRAIQDEIATDSQDAKAFYAQAPAPPVCPEAAILVVQADGKGIPMRRPAALEALPGQPKEGPRRNGKKKEATVVSVSTHLPYYRTPEEVRDSLFHESETEGAEHDGDRREKPVIKRTWASMKGKQDALSQAKVWAEQMDNANIEHRIALTDGLEALQNCVDADFPEYERILDIIHPLGYLWSAADANFGSKTKESRTWAYDAVLRILQGNVRSVINELYAWAKSMKDNDTLWKAIQKATGYFENNQNAMKYDEYLAKGWPIATGIIEGACRHVVKDRCERSGMMWTEQGVQAFLQLRCVHINGDWDAYHDFRMRQRHQQIYGIKHTPNNGLTDSDVYRLGAGGNYDKAA